MQNTDFCLYSHLLAKAISVQSTTANTTSGIQTSVWWYRPKPYLWTITSISFSQNGLLQQMVLFTHLLRKTFMIFGTIVLDIHSRMHLLLLMLLVCPLLLYQNNILPAKAVPWGRCMIILILYQISMLLVLLDLFTQLLLGQCPLNLELMHITICPYVYWQLFWICSGCILMHQRCCFTALPIDGFLGQDLYRSCAHLCTFRSRGRIYGCNASIILSV